MAGYTVPRSVGPGEQPPQPLPALQQLSKLPSAYTMARNGAVNLSELAITEARLGLGTESAMGDYLSVQVQTGNAAEGLSFGRAVLVDGVGLGNGSTAFVDTPRGYSGASVNFADAGLGFNLYDPQRIENTIEESPVSRDQQTVSRSAQTEEDDPSIGTQREVVYGEDGNELVQPSAADNPDEGTVYANPEEAERNSQYYSEGGG